MWTHPLTHTYRCVVVVNRQHAGTGLQQQDDGAPVVPEGFHELSHLTLCSPNPVGPFLPRYSCVLTGDGGKAWTWSSRMIAQLGDSRRLCSWLLETHSAHGKTQAAVVSSLHPAAQGLLAATQASVQHGPHPSNLPSAPPGVAHLHILHTGAIRGESLMGKSPMLIIHYFFFVFKLCFGVSKLCFDEKLAGLSETNRNLLGISRSGIW